MREDRLAAAQQIRAVLRGRLAELDTSLHGIFEDTSRQLSERVRRSVGADITPTSELTRLQYTEPLVRRLILVNSDNQMIYPPPPSGSDPARIEDYGALAALADSRPRPSREAGDTKVSQSKLQQSRASSTSLALPQPVYHVWYRDEGTQLSLWWPREDGSAIGILLERARWIAEITARLPDTQPVVLPNSRSSVYSSSAPPVPQGVTTLVDQSGQIVYRWGDRGDLPNEPQVQLVLSEPLASWQLRYYTQSSLVAPNRFTPMYAAFAGLGVLLVSLGAYVTTSLQRQIRLAKQRVTFASQVSHELRTPLTNIRLYTELAERDVKSIEHPSAVPLANRLAVIDSETRRLSRLVSGVMEIIREDGRARPLRIETHHVDELIDSVLLQFEPSFAAAGIEVKRTRGADVSLCLDADCLEMILVNLFSNVEKYAASGGIARVDSRVDDCLVVIRVADHGPGIARRHAKRVFKAFRRLDDSVSSPSGTGIGLTIARRAARRHGGDVRLLSSQTGACFEVTIVGKPTNAT